MMKVCKLCGTEFEDFANYCNACDVSLDSDVVHSGKIAQNRDSGIDLEKQVAITKPKHRVIKTHHLLGSLHLVFLAVFSYGIFIEGDTAIKDIAPLVLFSVFATIHFYIAKGIRSGASWSENASIVIAALLLLAFPVGTVVGAFMFFNIFSNSWDPKSA